MLVYCVLYDMQCIYHVRAARHSQIEHIASDTVRSLPWSTSSSRVKSKLPSDRKEDLAHHQ